MIGGCRHGVPLLENCPACDLDTDLACYEFWHAVNDGEWDEDGYTMKDRRAQAKRKAQKANVASFPEQAA